MAIKNIKCVALKNKIQAKLSRAQKKLTDKQKIKQSIAKLHNDQSPLARWWLNLENDMPNTTHF